MIRNIDGEDTLKYYVLIIMMCVIPLKGATIASTTATATESNKAKQYYISDSPYYTAGYLAKDAKYSQLIHGPSPYWRSKNISKPVNIFLRRKYI